jgi:hypothetical protein
VPSLAAVVVIFSVPAASLRHKSAVSNCSVSCYGV